MGNRVTTMTKRQWGYSITHVGDLGEPYGPIFSAAYDEAEARERVASLGASNKGRVVYAVASRLIVTTTEEWEAEQCTGCGGAEHVPDWSKRNLGPEASHDKPCPHCLGQAAHCRTCDGAKDYPTDPNRDDRFREISGTESTTLTHQPHTTPRQ